MTHQLPSWSQISREDNPEFQRIVKLLTEFDEKTGRFNNYANPESHYARKAIGSVDPSNLKVYINHLGGYVYSIVAECSSVSGHVVTAWVHEDGIAEERKEAKEDHPVHNIVCVSDLFKRAIKVQAASDSALMLMSERIQEEVPA